MMNGIIIGLALMLANNGVTFEQKRNEIIKELKTIVYEEMVNEYDDLTVIERGSSNGEYTLVLEYYTNPLENGGAYHGYATIVINHDGVTESYTEYTITNEVLKDSTTYDLDEYYEYMVD